MAAGNATDKPVTYTARRRFGTAEERRDAIAGLIDMLNHMEAFDCWLTQLRINPHNGVISVTLTKELPQVQLQHLGLNDDGA